MTDITPPFRYVILPGRPPWGFPAVSLHDRVYETWQALWSEVLAEVGAPGPSPDEFLRMDRVTALLQGDSPVGVLCHSFFNLHGKASRDQGYLRRFYTPDILRSLTARGCWNVASFEFLGVAPAWRGRQSGRSVAALLIALGLRQVFALGAEAAIAAARVDVGVERLSLAQGGETLGQSLTVHGRETALVAFYPEAVARAATAAADLEAERLWAERVDYTDRMMKNGAGTAAA